MPRYSRRRKDTPWFVFNVGFAIGGPQPTFQFTQLSPVTGIPYGRTGTDLLVTREHTILAAHVDASATMKAGGDGEASHRACNFALGVATGATLLYNLEPKAFFSFTPMHVLASGTNVVYIGGSSQSRSKRIARVGERLQADLIGTPLGNFPDNGQVIQLANVRMLVGLN